MKRMTVVAVVSMLIASVSAHASEGDLLWSSNLSSGFTWSTPVVLPDAVLLQDQSGSIEAFSVSNGQLMWQSTATGGGPTGSPVYANGSAFMIDGSSLYRIDVQNGDVLSSFTAEETISSQSPAIYNNLVIFGTSNKIYAVDFLTMTTVWSGNSASSNPINVVVVDDIAYVAADKLYALSASTGALHWMVDSPSEQGFYIAAVRDNYLAVFDNNWSGAQLHAYQLADSRTTAPTFLWSAEMGNNSADNSPPVIEDSIVYATGREGVLRAFSFTGNGSSLWEMTVRDNGSAPALPIVLDGAVYIQKLVGDSEFQLVSLNAATGAQNWITSVEDMGIAWGEPTIRGEKLYLATDHGGTLYAFEVANHSTDWTMIKQNAQLTGNTTPGVTAAFNFDDSSVSLPQVHVDGGAVFDVTLVPENLEELLFYVDLADVAVTTLPESDMAVYSGSTGLLVIPELQFGETKLHVTLQLLEALADKLRFQVTEVSERASANNSADSENNSTAATIAVGHDGVDFSAGMSGGSCDGTTTVGWDVQDGYSISWSPSGKYVSGENGDGGFIWYSNNSSDATYSYVEDLGAVSLDSVTSVPGNWPLLTDEIAALKVGHTYVASTKEGYVKFNVTSLDATHDCSPFTATYVLSETTSF